jgi:P-type E1-E2 ATPase
MLPLEQLNPGDVMIVRPGEIVPADGVLLDDEGSVDYAFVTGEQSSVALRRDRLRFAAPLALQ